MGRSGAEGAKYQLIRGATTGTVCTLPYGEGGGGSYVVSVLYTSSTVWDSAVKSIVYIEVGRDLY